MVRATHSCMPVFKALTVHVKQLLTCSATTQTCQVDDPSKVHVWSVLLVLLFQLWVLSNLAPDPHCISAIPLSRSHVPYP